MIQIAVVLPSRLHAYFEVLTALPLHDVQFKILEDYSEYELDFDGFILFDQPEDKTGSGLQALMNQCDQNKPILGIGTGAIYLAEIGLVPGLEGYKSAMTYSDMAPKTVVYLTENYQYNAFTRHIAINTAFYLPAPSMREFIISPALLLEMEENGLVILRYEKGIAAVSNKAGNVMAVLPEFLSWDWMLQSMRDYMVKGYRQRVLPLYYYPRIR